MTTTRSRVCNASRNAVESAREWAGLADSMIIARKRSGWSVSISSAMALQGSMPPNRGAPVTGLRLTSRL